MDTINLLRDALRHSGYVDITSAGNSMFPFIQNGNRCRFDPISSYSLSTSELRLGDVVLFAVGQRLIAHRLHHIERTGDRVMLICKGDSNLRYDQPVPLEEVVGRLVRVKWRFGGFRIDSWLCKAWSAAVLHLPYYTRWAIWSLRMSQRYHRLSRRFPRRAA